MRVFVYPEKTREELGAKRWEISWEALRDSAKHKLEHEGVDIDFDVDVVTHYLTYASEQLARTGAKQILDSGMAFFGAVTLTAQTVDWFVEEDRVAEWRDCGRPEEIS